jgi:hypothetical protein
LITYSNTDRKKVLQTGVLTMMRVMRSVLCEVHPARLTPLPSPQVSRLV